MEPHEIREAVEAANRGRRMAEQARDRVITEMRELKALLGVKVKANGSITIDYVRLTETLGPEQCAELAAVIEGGKPKEKRRISVTAEARPV